MATVMKKPEPQYTAGPDGRRPPRVLAGFGGLADEVATIDAALALARAMHAEITGHFVEESNLLDFAGLPFARVVRATGRTATTVEAGHMKQELAHAASTWRRALVAKAERSRITCRFDTSTGEYCSEIARVTAASDFVVINPANVARHGRARARTVLESIPAYAGLVVLPEHRKNEKGPVLLLLGAQTDHDAPELAQRLAEAAGTDLVIRATAASAADEANMRRRIAAAIGPGAQMTFTKAATPDADPIADIAALKPSFIVWPGWNAGTDKDRAEELLRATGAPLLLLKRKD